MSETITETRTPAVGDVLESSWGYDQTNIDFFQVVRVTATTVTLRKIAARSEGHEPGYSPMSDHVVPVRDEFIIEHWRDEWTKPMRRKFRQYRDTYYVSITSYASAGPWSGTPSYTSWYA